METNHSENNKEFKTLQERALPEAIIMVHN